MFATMARVTLRRAMWIFGVVAGGLAPTIGDTVTYSVRIKAKDPWNVLLGGSWELSERWSIALELGGVLDRFQATGAAMFRF
jgi:hypothetical protein